MFGILPAEAPTGIDLGTAFDTALSQVTSGVTDNAGSILIVAGSLLAVGVVWKLVKKFTASAS